jgi:hypothetical protein
MKLQLSRYCQTQFLDSALSDIHVAPTSQVLTPIKILLLVTVSCEMTKFLVASCSLCVSLK